MTANNQISVPFTTGELVKTVEIVFNAGTLFAHAQIAEIFIHIKKLVPGERLDKVYSSGSSVTAQSTDILAESLTICEDWNLSIDFEMPNRPITERKTFLSIHANKNFGKPDQRMLAVSIQSDQSRVMLVIAYRMDTNKSFKYKTTKKVNAGNWVNLKISQMSGVYEIKVDYKLIYSKTNTLSKTWTNMNLVTGNINGTETNTTKVYYRNLKVTTCKTEGKIKELKIKKK